MKLSSRELEMIIHTIRTEEQEYGITEELGDLVLRLEDELLRSLS
jgi:hypothetical protein